MSEKQQLKFTNVDTGQQSISYPTGIVCSRVLPRVWWKPSTWFNRIEYYTEYVATIPEEINSRTGDGDNIIVEYKTEWIDPS